VAQRVRAPRKISLIKAPRVSIVINGDEEEEGTRDGKGEAVLNHYSVSALLIVGP